MKIAYTIASFPRPSETFIVREVAGLRALGVEVSVIAAAPAGPEQKLSAAMTEERSRTIYLSAGRSLLAGLLVPLRLGFTSPKRLLSALGLAAALWREAGEGLAAVSRYWSRACAASTTAAMENADGVIGHWPWGAKVAALASALTGAPFSFSVHAHEVAHDNAHFPVIGPKASFICFCNRAAMEHALSGGLKDCRGKCRLIYHGVNTDKFSPVPMPPASPFRVLSVGRLTETKGFDRLIAAVSGAVKRGLDARLTIVGDGPDRKKLEAMIAELGLSEVAELRAWVDFEDMPEVYGEHHLLMLMASPAFHDGLPNVVLESMSCGRPVILSSLPAAGEAVSDGVNGAIIHGEADAGAEALCSMASDSKALAAMGAAARETVLARFSEQSCIHSLLSELERNFGRR